MISLKEKMISPWIWQSHKWNRWRFEKQKDSENWTEYSDDESCDQVTHACGNYSQVIVDHDLQNYPVVFLIRNPDGLLYILTQRQASTRENMTLIEEELSSGFWKNKYGKFFCFQEKKNK